MKILKKISTIEVKRTFVVADQIAHVHKGKKLGNNRKFLKELSENEFNKKLIITKRKILKLNENKLNKLISPEWPKRINAYNNSNWFIAEFNPSEIGVWNRAGNLPLRWTNRSLAETAEKMKRGLIRNSKSIKRRPKHAIPSILKIKDHLEQKEKYLYPIVFKTDTGTQGRKRLKRKMKGDIDDGCMRSIAMAMSGRNPITVYFGVPKKNLTK
jgi:hypothetical protein